ncbi:MULTISPECIES: LysR family transcriptional regulator [Corallococcus]|uniref:LysR family transcriptional regulator n=1 Tax=Corallococcus TaxID=83461 RepID=UPI002106F209|nr:MULTISPECIES: LysR family transcriptional regulator [Corallococcus]
MYQPGLNDLDAVLAVARRSSFRGAALELGMSTTAMSSAIAKLEAHPGVRLFNRTTRSVSLTDAGRAFVEQVAPGLEGIRGAMDAARAQQAKPSGMLRINTFATAAREILAPLVLEYLRRHPDVHVDVVTEGRLVDVVAEGFDFGVRMANLVPTDMIAIPLGAPHAMPSSLRRRT